MTASMRTHLDNQFIKQSVNQQFLAEGILTNRWDLHQSLCSQWSQQVSERILPIIPTSVEVKLIRFPVWPVSASSECVHVQEPRLSARDLHSIVQILQLRDSIISQVLNQWLPYKYYYWIVQLVLEHLHHFSNHPKLSDLRCGPERTMNKFGRNFN